MSLVRSVATVGGYTGISRILGFVRDIMIANVVGASPVADAFFAAFRLPNLFRRLFAEGAFNAAFVPLFARRLEQEGEAAARRFAEEALSLLVSAMLVISALCRAGMPLRFPRPRLTPAVKRLMALMLPGMLSAGALQINIFVGSSIASWQEGAFSFLYYADRVYQLPLGLIGIAIGIVLLPDLARKLRAGAEGQAMHSLNRGLEFALLLTLPATVALI